jgi:hypothetical protein
MAHAHPVTAEGHLLHRSVLPIGSPRPAPGSLVNRLASTRGIASPDSFRDRGEGFGHLLGRALPHLRSAFTSATGGVWAPRPSRIRSKPIRPRERHILDELGPTSNPLDSDGRRGSGASILLCLQHGQPRTAGASAGGRTGAFDPMVLSGNPPPVAGASAFPVPTRGAGAQARAGRRASGRSHGRAAARELLRRNTGCLPGIEAAAHLRRSRWVDPPFGPQRDGSPGIMEENDDGVGVGRLGSA